MKPVVAGKHCQYVQFRDRAVPELGPDEDGYELLCCVRKEHPDGNTLIPAIAVTGYATKADRDRTRAARFRAHLANPIELSEFFPIVAELATEEDIRLALAREP